MILTALAGISGSGPLGAMDLVAPTYGTADRYAGQGDRTLAGPPAFTINGYDAHPRSVAVSDLSGHVIVRWG